MSLLFGTSHGIKEELKCSALLWIEPSECFKFQCLNAGSYECKYPIEFPKFLERFNPRLFRK